MHPVKFGVVVSSILINYFLVSRRFLGNDGFIIVIMLRITFPRLTYVENRLGIDIGVGMDPKLRVHDSGRAHLGSRFGLMQSNPEPCLGSILALGSIVNPYSLDYSGL